MRVALISIITALQIAMGHWAQAGGLIDVVDTLREFQGNWPEAALRTKLVGANDRSEVLLRSTIQFAFDADEPGFSYLLHVSSEGTMTFFPSGAERGTSGQSDAFRVKGNRGQEFVYTLFSANSLDSLLPSPGASETSIGDDRPSAKAFFGRLETTLQGARWTIAETAYQIVALEETPYTAREIERVLEQAEAVAALPSNRGEGGSTPTSPRAAPSTAFPTRVEFEFNSDQLTSQGREKVDVFGKVIGSERWQSYAVMLEGHTDDIGADAYNFDLSRRRAESVKTYLVRTFGIDPQRLQIVPYGESRPLLPNANEANRVQNRRVEFVFNQSAP